MENISKALLIAAGVLIGLLILSLGVYLFAYFGGKSAEVNQQMENQKIVEFNTKFTQFEGRTNIRIHEIASLINYVYENNDYYKNYGNYEECYQVLVTVDGVGFCNKKADGSINNDFDTNKMIKNYNTDSEGNDIYFSVSSIIYNSYGRVGYISFTSMNSGIEVSKSVIAKTTTSTGGTTTGGGSSSTTGGTATGGESVVLLPEEQPQEVEVVALLEEQPQEVKVVLLAVIVKKS